MLWSGIFRTIFFIGVFAAIAGITLIADKSTKRISRKLKAGIIVVLVIAGILLAGAAANAQGGVPSVQPPVHDIEQIQGGSMQEVYMLQGEPERTLQGSMLTVQ